MDALSKFQARGQLFDGLSSLLPYLLGVLQEKAFVSSFFIIVKREFKPFVDAARAAKQGVLFQITAGISETDLGTMVRVANVGYLCTATTMAEARSIAAKQREGGELLSLSGLNEFEISTQSYKRGDVFVGPDDWPAGW